MEKPGSARAARGRHGGGTVIEEPGQWHDYAMVEDQDPERLAEPVRLILGRLDLLLSAFGLPPTSPPGPSPGEPARYSGLNMPFASAPESRAAVYLQ